MAGLAAAPVMGMYAAGSYAIGQMAEGAQFQNQVNSSLQNNFRFTNPQSQTGYGFGQNEQRQIGSMLQSMGSKDMMTTPNELLGIMNQGAQMGAFRGVQDAKEFRQKFTEMKNTLKEIAQTFNTTLSEAVPFFQQARSQGFWTPQDITRHASQVRQVQATTGMSAAQSQAVMGMGAQMVRSIGGTGQQGSEMMARAQMISGSALRGGYVSSQQLGDAGFGTGAEGAENLGTMLAGATTRFARSRVGRWALASMMNKEGTGLDKAGLNYFASGAMSVGEMGSRARRNVSGSRAYQFVANEEEMRGELAQQGPEAALGMVRSLTGGRLHGGGDKDKLITRRIIQRFMGGTAKQADIVAKLAREMPRLVAMQAAQTEGSLDAQERQGEQMMQDTYEGFKRNLGQYWREKVTAPLKSAGADFSYRVGRAWSRFSDRLFGTGGRGVGLSADAVRGMVRSAETGNMAYMERDTAGSALMERTLGAGVFQGGSLGQGGARQMRDFGFKASGWRLNKFSSGDLREMQSLSSASSGKVGEEEARSIGYGSAGEMGKAMSGAGASQVQDFLKTGEALAIRGRYGGGELSGWDQQRYGKDILGRIQAGRAGEQARGMFAGVSGRQAFGILMAAQGGARGGFSGLGEMGGLEIKDGQTLREAVEKAGEESTEGLTKILNSGGLIAGESASGIKGVTVTEKSVEELKKDTRGESALKLFSQASELERNRGSTDEVKKLRSKARGLMAEIGNDKTGVSEEARAAAIRMSNETDPTAKAIAAAAGKSGDAIRIEASATLSETWKRRRVRFEKIMGGSGMGTLYKLAGGDKGGVGQAFREAMQQTGSGKGGAITGEDMYNRMTRLAEASAADPNKANEMLAYMKSEGLDKTDVGIVMGRAMSAVTEAKQLGIDKDIDGGKITSKARTGVKAELDRLGITPTDKEADAVIRGGAGTERIKGLLSGKGFSDKDIQDRMDMLKGGMTVGETLGARKRGAVAGSMELLSEKVAKRAGLDHSELTGKLSGAGTTGAVVAELEKHTIWFTKMYDALGKISRKEKVPQKTPDDQEG
jgi:hypothetical protein